MLHFADNAFAQKNVFTSKSSFSKLNNITLTVVIGLLCCYVFLLPHKTYLCDWFTVSAFEFTFEFKIDTLSKIMFTAVMFIASQVIIFARHYMLSDFSYQRFMLQLILTIASVQWLVLSGNLLTAFVGWQMIGLNLYLLLNHYHYKPSANRNAKKKFVVNRFGDVCFLTAVVLAMLNNGNSSFDQLSNIHSATLIFNSIELSTLSLILTLVFVAIMTKSALFPFHIWLPDTMEAPTPVSALMHAGVINSGGYLLARLSNVIINETHFMLLVFIIGVMTLCSGVLIKKTQNDIKRSLAYSTMSQMGYMIMQVGIGCFSTAVFHLITHGLFKAFLFLNSGKIDVIKKSNSTLCAKDVVVCLAISSIIFMSFNGVEDLTILDAFLFITLNEMITCIYKSNLSKMGYFIGLVAVTGALLSYYTLLDLFETTTLIESQSIFQPKLQAFLLVAIIAIYIINKIAAPLVPKSNRFFQWTLVLSHNKLYIENIYRSLLINPIRAAGDILNKIIKNVSNRSLVLSLIGFVSALIWINIYFSKITLVIIPLIIISILAHVCANRALCLNKVVLLLLIGQLSLLACLFVFTHNFTLASLFMLYFILLFAVLLNIQATDCTPNHAQPIEDNSLSSEKTVLATFLFFLIGLPFTPCFLLWISLIQSSLTMPLLTPFVLLSNILLCISAFHTLQDYVFTDKKLITLNFKNKIVNYFLGALLLLFHIYLCFFIHQSHYS